MGSTDKSAKLSADAEDEDAKNFKAPKHEDDVPQTEPVKPKTSSCSTIPGSAAGSNPGRLRHDSNSSCDSARSPSSDRMKRRRTTSLSSSPLSSFFFPPPSQGISNSPSSPSFSTLLSSSPSSTFVSSSSSGGSGSPPLMSLDEVMSAVNGVTNMALAHEIALDHNFKLEKFEPPQASLEKQVRDMVHQAFWDNLKEQLSHTPPVYTQAFVLLQEVRDQLLELTLPHQLRLRQQISDKLDLELIQQQARHHVLDFCEYSGYVVALMAQLCAPVRDEAIRRLRQLTCPVEVFRGVAETLDLMKLDMANYTIQMIRPTIVKHIVEYERKKFKEFLATQQDGLELTRAWVLKHVDNLLRQNKESGDTRQPSQAPPLTKNEASDTRQLSQAPPLLEDPLALRAFCNNALNNAYMELLQWPQDELLPETVCVDRERVLELRDRLHQVCLLSAVLLVTLNTATHAHPPLAASHDALRAELKRDLCPILDPAYTQQETLEALPNLTEQVLVTLERFMSRLGGAAPAEPTSPSPPGTPTLSPSMKASVRCQLGELRAPGHRVTTLLTERCLAFLSLVLSNTSGARNTALPAPFCVLQEEVARICGGFLRFTQHNRAVFGEYYFDMAEQRLKQALSPRHMSSPSAVSTALSTNPTSPSTNPTASSTNPTSPSIDPTALSPDKPGKYAEISPETAVESKLKPENSTEKPEKLADMSDSVEVETKVKNPIQDSGKKSRSEIEDVNVEKIEGGRADKKGEESVTFDGSAGKDTGEDKGSGITEQSSCVGKDNKDKNEDKEPAAESVTGKLDSEARKRWDSLDLD